MVGMNMPAGKLRSHASTMVARVTTSATKTDQGEKGKCDGQLSSASLLPLELPLPAAAAARDVEFPAIPAVPTRFRV
jgi:hypothetical protein